MCRVKLTAGFDFQALPPFKKAKSLETPQELITFGEFFLVCKMQESETLGSKMITVVTGFINVFLDAFSSIIVL